MGQTKDLTDRLNRHNSNRSKSTMNKGEWEIVIPIKLNSRSEAVVLEKKLIKKLKNIHD
ncbi:MAG: hypothetical protein CO128_02165 [Ignavibacteriales bacterium CG_4_9_14_3_um_filter_30_11]|nr:MAG: hypothetical protein CO128_02165 [Ignavibacteriales bacterium CG_4_9_14_3_um_filter_30_11]